MAPSAKRTGWGERSLFVRPKAPGKGDGSRMLMGEYQHNMDAKGRVTIPSRYREELGETFYVSKGLDAA